MNDNSGLDGGKQDFTVPKKEKTDTCGLMGGDLGSTSGGSSGEASSSQLTCTSPDTGLGFSVESLDGNGMGHQSESMGDDMVKERSMTKSASLGQSKRRLSSNGLGGVDGGVNACDTRLSDYNTGNHGTHGGMVDSLSPCYGQDAVMDDTGLGSVQPATALAVAQMAKDSIHPGYSARSMATMGSIQTPSYCSGQGMGLQGSGSMYMQSFEPHSTATSMYNTSNTGYHHSSSGLGSHLHAAHQVQAHARHLAQQTPFPTCNGMSSIHASAQFLHHGGHSNPTDAMSMNMNMNMHMTNHTFPSHSMKFPV